MPISNCQPIRLLDPCCWYKFTYWMTYIADPDQLASEKANWSGSTVCKGRTYPDSSGHGLIWLCSYVVDIFISRQEYTYKPTDVNVSSTDGSSYSCRTYIAPLAPPNCSLDLRPSPMYMDVIIRGANQNNLPKDYITILESIETNGFKGEVSVYDEVLKLISQS